MKSFFYLILSGTIFLLHCKDSSELMNIDHLYDMVLEIDNRETVGHGESNIFNAYVYGIRLNSDGTYQSLDDGYGQLNHWKSINTEPSKWSYEGRKLVFEAYNNGTPIDIKWKIVQIKSNELVVQETVLFDNKTFNHRIILSDKQDVE